MTPLFYTAIGVGLAAVAVTWYAVMSARDGYEDDTGYHPLQGDTEKGTNPMAGRSSTERPAEKDESVPPYMTAR
jgi:hypothetical protein